MKVKLIGLLVAVVLVGALVAVAARATSAYFSDTQNGKITGTIGQIKVSLSGGTSGDGTTGSPYMFDWANMLPGVAYSQTMTVQNISPTSNSEDFWLVFPNATALSALNSLGRYGAVEIFVDGGLIYSNNNLNDIPNNGTTGLPDKVQLASNVGPTASHVVIFRFEYASAMSTQEPGGVFNKYPVVLLPGQTQDPRYPDGYNQLTVNPADGSGAGLPFQIVATQLGIQPGDPGSRPVTLPF
jgi:hypothetical protein